MDPRKELCARIANMRQQLDKLVDALGNDPNLERPMEAAKALQAIQSDVNSACTGVMLSTLNAISGLIIEDFRRK